MAKKRLLEEGSVALKMQIEQKLDAIWIKKKAEQENGSILSVGGLISKLGDQND